MFTLLHQVFLRKKTIIRRKHLYQNGVKFNTLIRKQVNVLCELHRDAMLIMLIIYLSALAFARRSCILDDTQHEGYRPSMARLTVCAILTNQEDCSTRNDHQNRTVNWYSLSFCPVVHGSELRHFSLQRPRMKHVCSLLASFTLCTSHLFDKTQSLKQVYLLTNVVKHKYCSIFQRKIVYEIKIETRKKNGKMCMCVLAGCHSRTTFMFMSH